MKYITFTIPCYSPGLAKIKAAECDAIAIAGMLQFRKLYAKMCGFTFGGRRGCRDPHY